MSERLIIFDTTLRDGEQSPGASMTRDEKMRIARQLERLRVDVIEAGFPAASNGDFEAVKAIAAAIKDSIVCGLARANDHDIGRAGDALREASAGRIHTFIATSPIHMERKLRMTPDQVVEQAMKAVKRIPALIFLYDGDPARSDGRIKALGKLVDVGAGYARTFLCRLAVLHRRV